MGDVANLHEELECATTRISAKFNPDFSLKHDVIMPSCHASLPQLSYIFRLWKMTSIKFGEYTIKAMTISQFILHIGIFLALYCGMLLAMKVHASLSDSSFTPKGLNHCFNLRSFFHVNARSALIGNKEPLFFSLDGDNPASCSSSSCSDFDKLIKPATSWTRTPSEPPLTLQVICSSSLDRRRTGSVLAMFDETLQLVIIWKTTGWPRHLVLTSSLPESALADTRCRASRSLMSRRSFDSDADKTSSTELLMFTTRIGVLCEACLGLNSQSSTCAYSFSNGNTVGNLSRLVDKTHNVYWSCLWL